MEEGVGGESEAFWLVALSLLLHVLVKGGYVPEPSKERKRERESGRCRVHARLSLCTSFPNVGAAVKCAVS